MVLAPATAASGAVHRGSQPRPIPLEFAVQCPPAAETAGGRKRPRSIRSHPVRYKSLAGLRHAGAVRPPEAPVLILTSIELDLHIHAGRQFEPHEGVHRLVRRIEDVHQALVGAQFELVTGVLVGMR